MSDCSDSDHGISDFSDEDYEPEIWTKAKNTNEESVYALVPKHPRIADCLSIENSRIKLKYYRRGPLWYRLLNRSEKRPNRSTDLPLTTRLTWAIDIAQGIAHLHAHNVVWANGHLNNVLIKEDGHVVLCNFENSRVNCPWYYDWDNINIIHPICLPPYTYLNRPPPSIDVFAFGVMFFILLVERSPHTQKILVPTSEEMVARNKHLKEDFEKLQDPELNKYFGSVLEACYTFKYDAGDQLLSALVSAYQKWVSETKPGIIDGSRFAQQPDLTIPTMPSKYRSQDPPAST
ncbi:kinase-like domain-containing protein [Abortiporus biennis]|nr:kinase-like domain-containing protein [Abortiporus biennis]